MQNLQSETIRSTLRETIEKTLDSKLYTFNIDLAEKIGENNFIGIIYRVSFNAVDESNNLKGPINYLILKVAPQDLNYRNEWFVRPCFLREVYMYNEVRLINDQCDFFHTINRHDTLMILLNKC